MQRKPGQCASCWTPLVQAEGETAKAFQKRQTCGKTCAAELRAKNAAQSRRKQRKQ